MSSVSGFWRNVKDLRGNTREERSPFSRSTSFSLSFPFISYHFSFTNSRVCVRVREFMCTRLCVAAHRISLVISAGKLKTKPGWSVKKVLGYPFPSFIVGIPDLLPERIFNRIESLKFSHPHGSDLWSARSWFLWGRSFFRHKKRVIFHTERIIIQTDIFIEVLITNWLVSMRYIFIFLVDPQ